MIEAQVGWIVQAVRHLRTGRLRRLEVRADVAQELDAWVQRRTAGTVSAAGCRSWYLSATGRNTQDWPASTLSFRRRLRRLDLDDFGAVRPTTASRGRRRTAGVRAPLA